MKYRQFILGESLGMTISAIVILIGIALFGNNESEDKTYSPANIAESGVEIRGQGQSADQTLKVTFLNNESSSVTTDHR